ncbi:patatin-like phospholipase family protein [Flagellimonas iocasae]|uniref:Patatin-like phospholipase family protein n=1 Tax=Flagellimonas iocasae TaxID=2055905 RepID=A0ABW4Y208_9FLAO
MSKSNNTFHLGFTMAGAVSAGAYTAGFMDYILEALDNWENAKKEANPDNVIPKHNVMIDALGGASAGGMVSMITTLALYSGNHQTVKEVSKTKTGNILYDSWVFLDDDDSLYNGTKKGMTTFEKMLSTSDLTGDRGAPSLLNSSPIDTIAEKVFEKIPKDAGTANFPSYISEDLRLLLTITSLRPVDYKVKLSKLKSKFLDSTPGHKISHHDIVAHFKLNYDEIVDNDKFLPFRPNAKGHKEGSNREFLANVTKATGAFPIGLAPRYFADDFSSAYVNHSLSQRKAFDANMDIELDTTSVSDFQFTAVDGGAINNEPFDEILRTLVANHGTANKKNPKYGTVLIDPFPNFEYDKSSGDTDLKLTSIMDIVGYLIPTVLNQARNKQTDTYGIGLFKLMAFPRKLKLGTTQEVDHPPLATGGIGGFGGFLDIDFRIHDFFLGRKNAQNFLRGVFFMQYDATDKNNLFYGAHPTTIAKFGRTVDGKTYLPIIPDVGKLDKDDDSNPSRYKVQEFPKFKEAAFLKLRKPIKKRLKAVLKAELKGKVTNWAMRIGLGIVISLLSKKMTKWIMDTIIKDFKARGM